MHRFTARSLACILTATPMLALPHSAMASPNVAMNSAVFIEHMQADNQRSLEPAGKLSRGDRVVTILTWSKIGGTGGFTITNPLPRAIAYQASGDENEEVSVDGGKTWGKLEDLHVGSRMATPEDVTHVRWRVSATNAAQKRGNIAYSGIVR